MMTSVRLATLPVDDVLRCKFTNRTSQILLSPVCPSPGRTMNKVSSSPAPSDVKSPHSRSLSRMGCTSGEAVSLSRERVLCVPEYDPLSLCACSSSRHAALLRDGSV